MRFGLRSRVALGFGALSMLVAVLISLSMYLVSRNYLLNQRQSAGLSRAVLDSRNVDAAIAGGIKPGDAVNSLPVVEASQVAMRVGTIWYGRSLSVNPALIPEALIDRTLSSGGAQQRFEIGSDAFYAVGVYTPSGVFVEMFPLADLTDTLGTARELLAVMAALSFVIGGAMGSYFGGRVLQPVQQLGSGAQRLAEGDLSVRLPAIGDPDLDPISDSFNEMASAVGSRIDRERRFVANVSHELRSPLTTIVTTAELLEAHRGQFDEREGRLVSSLANQARRLRRILLDLLDISSVTAAAPVQREATELVALIAAVLEQGNLPADLLHGDQPIVVTDARRVERVVSNLIDNAGRHASGVRQILVVESPNGVEVHVDDAGAGIPAEQAPRLFEPFARGDTKTRDGAGLGLAIARDQAAAIGASLTVTDSPFGGARFTLGLPASDLR